MSEPQVIARFAKNKREEVVISFDTFRGVELLDLRIYANFEDPTAAAKPTRKGISIKRALLPELIAGLELAADTAKEGA